MSSSSGAKALSRDQWLDVMNSLREVTAGKKPWKHPGAPPFRPGSAYTPNAEEDQFMKNTTGKMQANALRGMVMWMAAPYIMFHIPAFRSSIFKNVKTPIWWCLGLGTIGYVSGTLRNADQIAEQRFRLENSPLAREGRWLIRDHNPHHPWLEGFEDEFNQATQQRMQQQQENQMQNYNNFRQEEERYATSDDGYKDQMNQQRGQREYNDLYNQSQFHQSQEAPPSRQNNNQQNDNQHYDNYEQQKPQYYKSREESSRDSRQRGQRVHQWDDNHADQNYNYGGYKQNSSESSGFMNQLDERDLSNDFVVDPNDVDEWDTPSNGRRR